jgi:hypothetical protein
MMCLVVCRVRGRCSRGRGRGVSKSLFDLENNSCFLAMDFMVVLIRTFF